MIVLLVLILLLKYNHLIVDNVIYNGMNVIVQPERGNLKLRFLTYILVPSFP